MIEIKKVTDVSLAQRICQENQIAWKPEYSVIATIDGKEILQCAVFSYENDRGEIYAIDGFDGDMAYLDGLCRAILNIMDIYGVKVVCLSKKYSKIAEYVGFKLENDRYCLNLEGFFSCGCCHNKENK